MKKLLSLISVFFFLSAQGQLPNTDFKNYLEKKNSLQKKKLSLSEKENTNPYRRFDDLNLSKSAYNFPLSGKLLFKLNNGTAVYELPQDRMLCLVPDMYQFNYNMPVLGKDIKLEGMPPRRIPFPKK